MPRIAAILACTLFFPACAELGLEDATGGVSAPSRDVATGQEPGLDLRGIVEQVRATFIEKDHTQHALVETMALRANEGRVWLTPYPSRSSEGQALELETTEIRRGSWRLRLPPEAVSFHGATLSLTRGEVEEQWLRGDDAFEHRYVLRAPPPGEGPLRIDIAVAGHRWVRQDEAGHHFVAPNPEIGVLYGPATWIDARGESTRLKVAFVKDHLQIEVPAETVEGSPYPVVLDPVVSAETNATTPVLGASTYWEESPALASDGSTYLAVWSDNRGAAGYDIYATRLTTANPPLPLDSTDIPIAVSDGDQVQPAVAYNGTDYLVVWADRAAGTLDIVGQRLSTTGSLLGGPLSIAAAAGDQTAPAVAADGSTWVVVWQDGRGPADRIYAARVEASGAVATSPFALGGVNVQRAPSLACGGGNCLVAWADGASGLEDIRGVRIAGEVLLDATSLLLAGPGMGRQLAPSVASSGSQYLIAWQDYRHGSYDIFAGRVASASGLVLDGAGRLVSGEAGQQTNPAVSFADGQYMIAWQDSRSGSYDIYGARTSTGGLVSDPAGIAVCVTPSSQAGAALVSAGGQFLVAWQEANGNLREARATAVSSSGVVTDSVGLALSHAANRQLAPAVAWDGANYFVVFADSRLSGGADYDLLSLRVSADGSTVVPPEGAILSAAAGDQVAPDVAFMGAQFLVVWQDRRSGVDFDVYGTRVNQRYVVQDAAGRLISGAPGDQTYPRAAFNPSPARYMVVWSDRRSGTNNDIYGARVNIAGQVAEAAGIPLSLASGDQLRPDVSTDRDSWLVVWGDRRGGATADDIYGALLSSGGTVLAGDIPISQEPGRQEHVRLEFAGDNYFAVWSDARKGSFDTDVVGARIARDGTVIDPKGILLAESTVSEARPDVARVGSTLFVAWRQQRAPGSERWDLYGRRYSFFGVPIEPAAFPISIAGGEEDQPAIASSSDASALVFYQRFDSTPGIRSERMKYRMVSFP